SLDTVEIRQLLQFLLDLVSDLSLHLICGRARPADADHHDLDGEVWVLGTSEVEVGIDAGGAQENNHEQHQRLGRDRPLREIKPFHDAPFHLRVGAKSLVSASTARTRMPGSSLCTPRVTTSSPLATPALTSAASSVKDAIVTGRSASAPNPSTT